MNEKRPSLSRWGSYTTWTPYATHANGSVLWASVVYNHATRGAWTFVIVDPDGGERIASARLKRGWTLTQDGEMIREDRRTGTA